jgi:S1-C subfamily serine protease
MLRLVRLARRLLPVLGLLLLLVDGAAAQTRPGAGNPDFTLVNRSQARIDILNVSPMTSDSWGRDLLGENTTVPPGGRHQVRLGRPGECRFDIRVIYQDRREEERRGVDLCAVEEIVMTGEHARAQGQPAQQNPPPAQGGTPRLVVNNTTQGVVNEIYARPRGTQEWGPDLLGQNVLPAGQRFTRELPAARGCVWSLRLVHRTGVAEEWADLDLCAGREVALAPPAQPAPGQAAPGGAAQRPLQLVSTGTGFYVTRQGHIVTNRHVIEGCTAVAIARPNGQRLNLRLLGEDAVNDLAILQLPGTASPLLQLRGQGAAIRAGDRVVVIGYPARQVLGDLIVTEGSVSGLRGPRGDGALFQYSAPIQGGNSGGPILDEAGLVVGVVVSRIEQLPGGRPAQNINFGIHLDPLRRLASNLGVNLNEAAPRDGLRTPDIVERSQAAVLPLDCLR